MYVCINKQNEQPLIHTTMATVKKEIKGNRFVYTLNGEVVRTSKNDYKYACIATTSVAKGATVDGKEILASLGNNAESTLKSMAIKYAHYCDMQVVEIQ